MPELLIAVICCALIGITGCTITIWAVTSRRWVHRDELRTREEIHDRDYAAGNFERSGWRDQAYDLRVKYEVAIKDGVRCKDQIVLLAMELSKAKEDLRVAEAKMARQNVGTTPTGNTALPPSVESGGQ